MRRACTDIIYRTISFRITNPRNLAKKHTFRTRRNEFYVRMYGSRLNRSVKGRFYAFKPLILAFLPAGLYRRLHKNREEKL